MEKVSNFNNALELILKHEGGYVNHPEDPGGETKYGISKQAYPNEDISGLTLERAAQLYRRDYWDRLNADDLPFPVGLFSFDTAVNLGTSFASKSLQRAVNALSDGVIGPKTIQAVWRAFKEDPNQVLDEIARERIEYYSRLTTFTTFGKGWVRRVNETIAESKKWIDNS
jgi:lysozyme family protein